MIQSMTHMLQKKLNRSGHRVWLALAGMVTCSVLGCAHEVSVTSAPGDAAVYAMSADAKRDEVLGKTPLRFPEERIKKAPGIVVQKEGFEPALVYLPGRESADLDIHVSLRPLDQAWVNSLPKDVAAKLQSTVLSDLLAFQTELYSLPSDQVQAKLSNLKAKYGHLAAFHYLVGHYFFYRNDYSAAAEAYAKAVELDPSEQRYRDMVLLNQMRSMESTKVVTIKAFEALGLAVRRIASSLGGSVVATRSHPDVPEPDGFRILIPSDPVFRPASPKLKQGGIKTMELVAKELQSLTKSFAIKVSVHTGSDPREEFDIDKPVLFKGTRPSTNPWQLSGERALAVMVLLRSQGVLAKSWSISGYGDGSPLVTEGGGGAAGGGMSLDDLKRSGLNRRIELDIAFYKGQSDKTFDDKDMESLRRSLEFFVTSDENGEATATGKGPGAPKSNSGTAKNGQGAAAAGTGAARAGTDAPTNAAGTGELTLKRKALESRFEKPKSRGATQPNRSAPNPGDVQDLPVPKPRAPKGK